MNKEDYVSLEVAKLLKEKGFPQIHEVGVICRLENKVNPYYRRTREITQSDIENGWCIFNETYPTLYEAAKWLRNKHNIDILIDVVVDSKKDKRIGYTFGIYTNLPSVCYSDEYETYEQALNAGILEALKLI